MSYTQPMVMVFQEYDSTSTSTLDAELPACIVGPCYHIIDTTEDEELAFLGNYTAEDGMENVLFPNNEAGALIEESSVSIVFKDAYITLVSEITPASTSKNSIVFNEEDYPVDVEIGDKVVFDSSDTEYRVTDVDAETYTIQINRTVPTDATTLTVYKVIDEFTLTDSTYFTLDCEDERLSIYAVKYTYNETEYTVSSAKVYVGYMALRQDLSNTIGSISDQNDIESALGKIVPENPLAYGVNVCLANSSGTEIYYIGVDSDDLTGYTAAKDRIEFKDPLYCIVPLTTSTSVLSMFKTHCEEMSESDVCKWRICIGTCELQTEETLCTFQATVGYDDDGYALLLTAANDDVAFIDDDVDAGDTLNLITTEDGEVTETYTVSDVLTDDMLTITPSNPFSDSLMELASSSPVWFTITRDLDKSDQAENIAAISESYGSARYVNIWPDVCIIDDVELPSYYLACAVAGGVASLPSQRGFTRLSMAGIDGIEHSNDYFSQTQLNTIAGGGTFIFVQDAEGAAPYVRHQLTTDMSSIEYQELSFVKNFDYVSYICRDAMDEYIGIWNITDECLDAIRSSLTSIMETLKLATESKIGAPIIDYNVVSVEQLEDTRDRVEAYVDITFPYPLNTIGLHLVSQ